jgi:ubiquinone/menaquinone biosynthesis C-methylase UbiE
VLEHLGYCTELPAALREFHRVLAPLGVLRLSVPDLPAPASATSNVWTTFASSKTQARWLVFRDRPISLNLRARSRRLPRPSRRP